MITKSLVIVLALIFAGRLAYSQTDSVGNSHRQLNAGSGKSLSLLLGYNRNRYNYGEVGLAMNKSGTDGHHPFAWAYFVSAEASIGNKFVLAPKIGAWVSGGQSAIAMGANLVYYTNFDNRSLRFRPEIGFGMGNFKIVYGYNIAITNSAFKDVIKSNLGLAYLISLKKVK